MFLDHNMLLAIKSRIPPLSLDTVGKRHFRILFILAHEKKGIELPELISRIELTFKKYPPGDIESHVRDLLEDGHVHLKGKRSLYTLTQSGEKFLKNIGIFSPEKCRQASTPSHSHHLPA